jgi:ribosome-associated heat shock protein Hsp15
MDKRSTHPTEPRVRVDKWLWAARFFKTRSLATHAVDAGRVTVNGERIKPARGLRVGDRVTVSIGDADWTVLVQALSERRGPADVARTLYLEDDASRAKRIDAEARRRTGVDPWATPGGRPEKRARRKLTEIRGY